MLRKHCHNCPLKAGRKKPSHVATKMSSLTSAGMIRSKGSRDLITKGKENTATIIGIRVRGTIRTKLTMTKLAIGSL